MNEGLIPKRYAKALYKFALEKGADKGLYSLMGNLAKSFADNPALDPAVANPFVDDARKIDLLTVAAGAAPSKGQSSVNAGTPQSKGQSSVDADAPQSKGQPLRGEAEVNEVYADFLKLLQQNKRLPMAGAIARAYCDIYRKENRIYRVTIVSAQPLDASEEERLKKLIAAHLKGGSAEFTMATDPELIGGFTVDIDNERLDASVKNELKQLRLKLLGQ